MACRDLGSFNGRASGVQFQQDVGNRVSFLVEVLEEPGSDGAVGIKHERARIGDSHEPLVRAGHRHV